MIKSTVKAKVMAFQGKKPKRTEIMINNQSLQQVSHFNDLGNDIGYNSTYNIEGKSGKFQNCIFRNKIH